MNHSTHKNINWKHGFTLVEVIGVTMVIAILCTISIPPVLRILEEAKARTERANLALIASEVKATFRQENLNDHNISSLVNEIPGPGLPAGDPHIGIPTYFEKQIVTDYNVGMYNGSEIYNYYAWYAKLARLRGQNSAAGLTLEKTGGPVREIALNSYGRRRIMLAGPIEADIQRYIILSFAFPEGAGSHLNLTMPDSTDAAGNGYATWFNDVYNHGWGVDTNAPTTWDPDWGLQSMKGKTYAERVLVERIVQRRFTVSVNNTSGLHDVHMYANMPNTANYVKALNTNTHFANHGGVNPVFENTVGLPRGFLEGRRVIAFRRHNAAAPGIPPHQMYSFLINEHTIVSIQD